MGPDQVAVEEDLHRPGRYEIGGFSDAAFTMIDLVFRRRDTGWPWEQSAVWANGAPPVRWGSVRQGCQALAAPTGHTMSTGIPISRASITVSAVPPFPDGGLPSQTATKRSARRSSVRFASS